MLKKVIIVTGMLALSSFAQNAIAETKIGFVNVVGLLSVAPQAETSRKLLEKEFFKRDKVMVALQEKIVKADKKYKEDAAILGEDERGKRERAILLMQRDLKRLQSEFNEDLSLRKNEELRLLQKTVAEAIDKVAKENKYDLIVNEGVVFASKDIDVSKKVLTQLQATYDKAGGKSNKKSGKAKK